MRALPAHPPRSTRLHFLPRCHTLADQDKDPALLASLASAASTAAAGGTLTPIQMRDLCAAFAAAGFFDVNFKSAMAAGGRWQHLDTTRSPWT